MFCSSCGTKQAEDAVFCSNCGTRINSINQGQSTQYAVCHIDYVKTRNPGWTHGAEYKFVAVQATPSGEIAIKDTNSFNIIYDNLIKKVVPSPNDPKTSMYLKNLIAALENDGWEITEQKNWWAYSFRRPT